MAKATKNFSYQEFLVSESYPELVAKTPLHKHDKIKIYFLAKLLLQPVRDKFGIPIEVTSGKRCKLLNMLVGGSSGSDHRYRDLSVAADWKFKEGDRGMLWKAYLWIIKNMKFTVGQVIIYLDQAGLPNFIHTSLPTEKHQSEFLVNQAGKFRHYDPKKDPHDD